LPSDSARVDAGPFHPLPLNHEKESVVRPPRSPIDDVSQLCRLLGDVGRLRLLLVLAEKGELDVKSLCAAVRQSQPLVSHSLTLLRLRGVVTFRRQGKHNLYRLHSQHVLDLLRTAISRLER
jgi:ArsR family transcriptional regulator